MQRVWHRKFDGCWYATFTEGDGQNQIKLLKGPKDRATKKLAEELLVKELKPSKKKSAPDWLLVNGVLRGFLRHSKKNHELSTVGHLAVGRRLVRGGPLCAGVLCQRREA